ncbi:transmembrane protein 145-like isoform X2 [Gigantopelta aegis]|uniref:transmembrane protein 145-like isoform X2 n=1 Tax=Gigantopelta aegis TaxID=1735272 RepID=UPI001B8873B0|nr:transmembrane protein 145-like isoform X2 [Gigantopelta aegis]
MEVSAISFCFVVVLSVFVSGGSAKWVEGYLDTDQDWKFLGRFCFLSEKGSLVYNFVYPVAYSTQDILLYYDTDSQWPSVYPSTKSCLEKFSVLSIQKNQVISLNTSYTRPSMYSGCKIGVLNGESVYNCTEARSFRSMRERWWYIAVSRCSSLPTQPQGMKLHYSMHMTNGPAGDMLYHEFSADEFYILPTDITFLLIHLIIFGLTIVCAAALRDRQLFHTTYKMYLTTVTLWTFHIFLLCVAFGKYSQTGRSERRTKVAARVFSSAADLIFQLMLILMGSGYTITRGKLKSLETVIFTVFTCIYTIVYIVLLIWEAVLFDPGQVLYIYQSPAGYGLIALHLFGWLWFLLAVFFTLKKYPSKAKFYIPFTIFYTIWFFATPLIILISNLALPQWMREKTVNGVELFIGLAGHVFFLVLTRPAAANTNFPYHVRTTQIGSLDGTEADTADPVDMSNSYSPGTAPDFSHLFLVSHTYSDQSRSQTSNGFNNNTPPPKYVDTPISNGFLPPVGGATRQFIPDEANRVPSRLPPITATAPPVAEELSELSVPPSYDALFQATSNSKRS